MKYKILYGHHDVVEEKANRLSKDWKLHTFTYFQNNLSGYVLMFFTNNEIDKE